MWYCAPGVEKTLGEKGAESSSSYCLKQEAKEAVSLKSVRQPLLYCLVFC